MADDLEKTDVSTGGELPSYRNGKLVTVPRGRKILMSLMYDGKSRIEPSAEIPIHKQINSFSLDDIYHEFNEYLSEYGRGVIACGRTSPDYDGKAISLSWLDEKRIEDYPESTPTITAVRPERGRCQGFFYVKEVEGRRYLYWHDPNSTNGSCVGYTLEQSAEKHLEDIKRELQKVKAQGKSLGREDIWKFCAQYLKRKLLYPALMSSEEYSIDTIVQETENKLQDHTSVNYLKFMNTMANYLQIGNILEDLRVEHSLDVLEAKERGAPFIEEEDFKAYAKYLRKKYMASSRLKVHVIFDHSLLYEDLEYNRPKDAPRFQHIRLMDLDSPETKRVFIELGGIKRGDRRRTEYDCRIHLRKPAL